MTNDTLFIHDVSSDEIKIVELTDAEQNKLDAERLAAREEKEAAKTAADALQAQRIQLLERLGLTAEEAKVLLGITVDQEA